MKSNKGHPQKAILIRIMGVVEVLYLQMTNSRMSHEMNHSIGRKRKNCLWVVCICRNNMRNTHYKELLLEDAKKRIFHLSVTFFTFNIKVPIVHQQWQIMPVKCYRSSRLQIARRQTPDAPKSMLLKLHYHFISKILAIQKISVSPSPPC